MISHNSSNKSLSISIQNNYLFNIISDKKLLYSFFNYLSVSEITKFMLMNKEIYSKFNNPDTYLFYKYMFKRYNSSFFFFDQKKIELRQLSEIVKLIKYSDELYKRHYNILNNLIVVYYFFGFIVLFDIFPIIYYFRIKLTIIILHIPFIIIWFFSIILLAIYFIMKRNIKNKINNFLDLSVDEIKNDKIVRKKLLKNIRRRIKYKNPKGFKIISSAYLILYTPLIVSSIWKVNEVVLFRAAAIGIPGIYYLYDLIKFVYIKRKQKNKLNIYKELFSKNQKDLDLFAIKEAEISNKMKRARIGGKMMDVSYFFGVFFWYFLYMIYIYMVISKLTDPKSKYKWGVILIPIDIVGVFFTLYTCIYLCSIWKLNVKYKLILIITAIITLVCFLVNFVILTNVGLEARKTKSCRVGVSIVFSISTIVHYIFNKKFGEKCAEIS